MEYFKLADGSAAGFDDSVSAPNGAQKITEDEFAAIVMTPSITKDQARQQLIDSAKVALENTDMVALRCFKAGTSFPAEWQAYAIAVRKIANGSDAKSIDLPAPPEFPEGT